MKESMNNIEIVTLAVYLLGGDSKHIDTEDIAIKTNELAPGRFSWRKYPDQINIEKVRTSLSDAKKPENGAYLLGLHSQGWHLSANGLKFAKKRIKDLENTELARSPSDKKEKAWKRHEKTRMLRTVAFLKVLENNADDVTAQEAESFFRVDDYVTGEVRRSKLIRLINTFGDDPDLGKAVKILAEKVREK
jgi:hypothetical protein